MQKISIYTNASHTLLIIDTPVELKFELRDNNGKLLVTGNKLNQPSIAVNIQRLTKGAYLLTIFMEGETLQKKLDL
ncbi:MAG TPA: T9SS type A sorting domain-containing protein [Chitinophagaceae bacterium]|nr:T9SS type A sorting domain-containing protein [Chitinophagaceae bacterium]